MRVTRARPSDVRKSTSSWTESVPLADALGRTVRRPPYGTGIHERPESAIRSLVPCDKLKAKAGRV